MWTFNRITNLDIVMRSSFDLGPGLNMVPPTFVDAFSVHAVTDIMIWHGVDTWGLEKKSIGKLFDHVLGGGFWGVSTSRVEEERHAEDGMAGLPVACAYSESDAWLGIGAAFSLISFRG
jgi:hypothetical protein